MKPTRASAPLKRRSRRLVGKPPLPVPVSPQPTKRQQGKRKRPPPPPPPPPPDLHQEDEQENEAAEGPRKRAAQEDTPPEHESETISENHSISTRSVSCCICMNTPSHKDLSTVDACEHLFCFDCIAEWSQRENSCPLCKLRFTTISRKHPLRGGAAESNVRIVQERRQEERLLLPPGATAVAPSFHQLEQDWMRQLLENSRRRLMVGVRLEQLLDELRQVYVGANSSSA